MPVFFVNAASTSSRAFFMDAAANTVMVFSCAEADVKGAVAASDNSQARVNATTPDPMTVLRKGVATLRGSNPAIKQVGVVFEMIVPEAPFRDLAVWLTAHRGSFYQVADVGQSRLVEWI